MSAANVRPEQLEVFLQQISDAADTLANFAACAAGRAEAGEDSHSFTAVQSLAERIAAIAALAQGAPLRTVALRLAGVDIGASPSKP